MYVHGDSACTMTPVDPCRHSKAEGDVQTILLVEEEGTVRASLREMLERCGVRCIAVAAVDEARSFVGAGAGCDLLLLGLTALTAEGIASLAAIRRIIPEIPCVIMSDQTDLDDHFKVSSLNVQRFVSRRIGPRDIRRIVGQVKTGR